MDDFEKKGIMRFILYVVLIVVTGISAFRLGYSVGYDNGAADHRSTRIEYKNS